MIMAPQQYARLARVEAQLAAYGTYPPATVASVFEADAEFPLEKLVGSVRDVVTAYEVLRMRFPKDDGGSHYLVIDEEPRIDFLENVAASRDSALEWLHEAALVNLDLQRGPMVRMLISRTSDHTYFAILVEHIVFDAVSRDVFLRAVSEAYRARSRGSVAVLNGRSSDAAFLNVRSASAASDR